MKNVLNNLSLWIVIICLVVLVAIGSLVLNLYGPAISRQKPVEYAEMTLNSEGISFSYPKDWKAFVSPDGEHGDKEVIGGITVLGHPWPFVIIAKAPPDINKINDAINWGENRINGIFNELSLTFMEIDDNTRAIRLYLRDSHLFFATISLKCKDLYLNSAGNWYAITFCAREKDWNAYSDIFDFMQSSISTK